MAFGRRGVVSGDRPAEADRAVPVEFDGRRGALLGLVVTNMILTVLTLGLYRFWAKTRLRRYFWSNVRIGTEPFEYTGRPSELFLGFLVVVAVLAPAALLYGVVAVVAEGEVFLSSMLDLVYLATIYALVQVAVYRAWRYRMSRTTWRAIRFGLDGSAWRFLGLAFGWSFLVAVTLGVAYPYLRIALVRYRVNRSRYGNAPFVFEGSGGDLIGSWILVLLIPAIAAVIGLLFLSPLGVMPMTGTLISASNPAPMIPGLLILVGLPLGYVWYRVKEFRYMVGHTRFGAATFRSEARASLIVGLALATGAAFFGVIAVAVFILGVGGVGWLNSDTDIGFSAWHALGIVAIVVGVLAAPVLAIVIFRFGLVRHLCRTLTIMGIEIFAQVAQTTDKGPKRGEGLADALDVGTF